MEYQYCDSMNNSSDNNYVLQKHVSSSLSMKHLSLLQAVGSVPYCKYKCGTIKFYVILTCGPWFINNKIMEFTKGNLENNWMTFDFLPYF